MYEVFTKLLNMSLTASFLVMIIFILVPGQIMSIFMKDPEIVGYGARFIRAGAFGLPFLAMDFIGVGVYQAFGKGSLSFFFAVGRKIILEIPALFILNHFYPLYGLAWAQPCAEFILGITAVFVLRKIFRNLEKEMIE